MIFALCDTETTGLPRSRTLPLSAQPRVCELGIILYDGAARKVVDEYSQLINPGIPMPADVIKIHGITDEAVAMMPPFAEAWKEAVRFFLPPTAHFVAHNAPFDKQLLEFEFARMELDFALPEAICSAQEHYHLFGKRPKLIELYKLATGKEYAHKHRAIDDTRILLEALESLNFFDAFCGPAPKAVEALKPGTYDNVDGERVAKASKPLEEDAGFVPSEISAPAPAPAPAAVPSTATLHITRPS